MPLSSPVEGDLEGWGSGVRLEVNKLDGKFDQTLSSGQSIRLDSVLMTGPGTVAIDFEHTFVGIGFYGGKSKGKFGFDGEVGLGSSLLGAGAVMGGLSDTLHLDSLGLYFGGAVSLQVLEPLSVFYELKVFAGSNDVEIFTAQLGAKCTPSDVLSISAGLQSWEYIVERDGIFAIPSDLRLNSEGLFFRLEFAF